MGNKFKHITDIQASWKKTTLITITKLETNNTWNKEFTYDDKEDKMIYDGHTLPCLHHTGENCKSPIQTSYTSVWIHWRYFA